MEYVFTLFLIFYTFYLVFLLFNIFGLLINKKKSTSHPETLSASIIIAIRNGQNSINKIIQDLLNQDYRGIFEIILVDDQSYDKTKEIIQNAEKKSNKIKYVSSKSGDSNLKFKKRALDAGIKFSNNKILVFTDVDCRLPPSWLSSILSQFTEKVDYVIGFSRAKQRFGFANLFQRVDFLILMFSALAVTRLGFPLACSGQNQAYRRSLFLKVGGYDSISQLLMGDDSIFLQKCLKKKIGVKFCEHPQSYVFCRSEEKWRDLFFQRMRWAGDGNIMWRYNFFFYTIMIATALSNFFILFLILNNFWTTLFFIIISKFIVELILTILGSHKFKETISILSFIYWFSLNIPYVCIMTIASFFTPFLSWKNRTQ